MGTGIKNTFFVVQVAEDITLQSVDCKGRKKEEALLKLELGRRDPFVKNGMLVAFREWEGY